MPTPTHEAARSLLVIADEVLVPANHGGRVDRWNRWRWLKSLGWTLRLVCWQQRRDAPRLPADIDLEGQVFDEVICLTTDRGISGLWKRARHLGAVPFHAAARQVDGPEMQCIFAMMDRARPDALILDGLYGGLLARALSQRFALPLIYRAHNVEHRYIAGQARHAASFSDKLAISMATLGLRQFERDIRAKADWSLDISVDDMRYWHDQGLVSCSWAPPLFAPATAPNTTTANAPPEFDLVYLGNLNTPNNIAGLRWFMSLVMPILRFNKPDISVLIAGSRPHRALLPIIEGQENVTVLANPEFAAEVLSNGRVIMNPILSGSGVNIKTVEALFYSLPVVTTPIGAQGLPDQVRQHLIVASTAQDFADGILNALSGRAPVQPASAEVLSQFGRQGALKLCETLCDVIRRREL